MILDFSNILTLISLILIISTSIYLIYEIFSRNKYKYNKKLYSEPPTNDPPALLNSFFNEGINNGLGEIDIKCFYCSLLDLINRKYISVKIINKKNIINKNNLANKKNNSNHSNSSNHSKSLNKIILSVHNNVSNSNLHSFEKNILKCVSALEYNGDIDILNTKNVIRKRLKVNIFQKNYDAWMKNFHQDCFKNNNVNYFNNNINKLLKAYSWFLILISIFSFILAYIEISSINLILSCIMGILGIYLILNPSINLVGWTDEGKKLKISWESFKKYHYQIIKSPNNSQELLNEEINYLPQLVALGISKSFLLKNFSLSDNNADTYLDTYLFLKYADLSLIKDIVKEFLAADGSFDPKYYNTSGNFVEGYGL